MDQWLKSVLAAVRAERFDFVVSSPLLDFIQELPENRPSEVVWQTARYVVFDEGFNDGLQRIKVEFTNHFLPLFVISTYFCLSNTTLIRMQYSNLSNVFALTG